MAYKRDLSFPLAPTYGDDDDKKKKKNGKSSSGKLRWQKTKKSDRPMTDWEKKKADEKAQRKREREGRKSFRGHDLKVKVVKMKTNPQNKKKKCNASGGTKNCPKSYLGGKN